MPFVPSASSIVHLKRTCPRCRRNQIVALSKKNEAVACKFCGAEVPPRKPPSDRRQR